MSNFFKNELFFISHSPLKDLQNVKLLSYTRLKLTESANSILRKIELKCSEGSKAKSPSNVECYPPVIFLIIIKKGLIVSIIIINIFVFYLCYYKKEHM